MLRRLSRLSSTASSGGGGTSSNDGDGNNTNSNNNNKNSNKKRRFSLRRKKKPRADEGPGASAQGEENNGATAAVESVPTEESSPASTPTNTAHPSAATATTTTTTTTTTTWMRTSATNPATPPPPPAAAVAPAVTATPSMAAMTTAEDAKLQRNVATVQKSLQKNAKSKRLQKKAWNQLRGYLSTTASSSKGGDHTNHARALQLQERYVHHLLDTSDSTNNTTANTNIMPLLMHAMTTHCPNSKSLTMSLCRILYVLTKHSPQATQTAIPPLLQVMRLHKKHSIIQCLALTVLSTWGTPSDRNADHNNNHNDTTNNNTHDAIAIAVVEAGALPVIWTNMLLVEYKNNASLQDRALKTLLILACPKENRPAFVAVQGWKALTQALSIHGHAKPKLTSKALKIMRYIALDHPQAVAKKALPLILSSMKTHLTNEQIQRHGCAVLLALSANESLHSVLWQANGGRDAILAAMQHHSHQEEIQKTAILALQKLPHDNPAAGGEPNTTSCTSTAGTTTTASTTTTTTTSSTLSSIMKRTNQKIAGKSKPKATTSATTMPSMETLVAVNSGMEAMVARLQADDTPATTCANIAKAMIRLAQESHTNKLDFATAHGLEALVASMKRFATDYSLQKYGCQALCVLSSVEQIKGDLARDAAALAVIVHAIHQHTSTPTSHGSNSSCGANDVGDSTTGDTTTGDATSDGQKQPATGSALGTTTAGIANNKTPSPTPLSPVPVQPPLQHLVALHGILALVRISQRPESHVKLMTLQAPPTISTMVRAMTTFGQHHTNILHKSMVIFSKLLGTLEQQQQRLHQVVLLQQQQQRQSSRQQIFQKQFDLVRKRFQTPMIQEGLPAILQAMTLHPEHPHIQRVGCHCLAQLHCQETTWAMVTPQPQLPNHSNSLQVIVRAMVYHKHHVGIQMAALRAITDMTQFSCHLQYWALMTMVRIQEEETPKRDNDDNDDEVQEGGGGGVVVRSRAGLPALVASMQNHPLNASLQQMCVTLLWKLTQHRDPTLRTELVRSGAMDAMLMSMRDFHPAHPYIQQFGIKTLYNLSFKSSHHGAMIFKRGGLRVVLNARIACPDDPFVQRFGTTLLVQLVVAFFVHWFVWVVYHIV